MPREPAPRPQWRPWTTARAWSRSRPRMAASSRCTSRPRARNVNKFKAGEQVGAQYLAAAAIFVRKSDAPPQVGEKTTVSVAPKGEKPAGMVVKTVELTAKVEGVTYAARTIALRGPQGNVEVMKVDDSVKRLEDVKQGDEVVVRHTKAIVLTLNR